MRHLEAGLRGAFDTTVATLAAGIPTLIAALHFTGDGAGGVDFRFDDHTAVPAVVTAIAAGIGFLGRYLASWSNSVRGHDRTSVLARTGLTFVSAGLASLGTYAVGDNVIHAIEVAAMAGVSAIVTAVTAGLMPRPQKASAGK